MIFWIIIPKIILNFRIRGGATLQITCTSFTLFLSSPACLHHVNKKPADAVFKRVSTVQFCPYVLSKKTGIAKP